MVSMIASGLKQGAANSYARSINSFLSWLHENGHTPHHLRIPQTSAHKRVLRTYTLEEARRIISHKPASRVPITPSEIRLLDPKEPYSSWKWDVTPMKSDVHEIHLIAEAIAELPKLGERPLYIKTFDYTVRVRVTKDSALDWAGKNWQYILGSIVIPLIGWLWLLYSKRKEKKEKEAGEKKPPDPPKIIIP